MKRGWASIAFTFLLSQGVSAQVGEISAGFRFDCPVGRDGSLCGRGEWPARSGNQYVFGSGIQAAALISPTAGFEWAGDTVSYLTFEVNFGATTVDQGAVYSFPTLPEDDHPSAAAVANLPFLSGQLERRVIGDRQTWQRLPESFGFRLDRFGRYGGLFSTQRTFSFGRGRGLEDVLFVVNTIYNASSLNPDDYSRVQQSISSELLQHARLLHDFALEEGVEIPASGFTLEQVHIGLASDPDVGRAGTNSSTAVLPLNAAVSYKSDFNEPSWEYDPAVFKPPFGIAPGMIANKFLGMFKNDSSIGLPMTFYTNYGYFDPPHNASGLFLQLSGQPGGSRRGACSNPEVTPDRYYCFLIQNPTDIRFLIAAGGVGLAPGESLTLVHAYILAPAMGYIVEAFRNGVLQPGVPGTPTELIDPSFVRNVERAAGWAGATDLDADGRISEGEIEAVPYSLIWKAQQAQLLFENGFQAPAAPAEPDFHLIPGEDRVTLVWQKSGTEFTGDPFFAQTSDPSSSGYDPNYREFDVEGYRVYRGTTPDNLALIASFDYAGTTFVDHTGSWDYGDRCAPELGPDFQVCPVDFSAGESVSHPIVGDLFQVDRTRRTSTSTGRVALLPGAIDSSEALGFAQDNGVPFAFIDEAVERGQTYYYAVTAFDYNSLNSGPASQESPLRPTAARVLDRSPNQVNAPEVIVSVWGDSELDVTQPRMTVDRVTGILTPPTPQANPAWEILNFVPELADTTSASLRFDSLRVFGTPDCIENNPLGACYVVSYTVDKSGTATEYELAIPWPVWSAFGGPSSIDMSFDSLQLKYNPDALARWGLPPDLDSPSRVGLTSVARQYIQFSSAEGQAARRGFARLDGNISDGGSRWFSGEENTTLHPAAAIRVGSLDGVDTVWAPIHDTDVVPRDGRLTTYAESSVMQCFSYHYAGLSREADVKFTWANSTELRSVRDVTHDVDVPFSPLAQASYGFIDDFNGDGVLSWRDFDFIENVLRSISTGMGFCANAELVGSGGRLSPQPVIMATSTDGDTRIDPPVTGTGFGLYVNGERYIFEGLSDSPADGDVWTLRTYAGIVSARPGSFQTPFIGSPVDYEFAPTDPSPAIPGMSVRVEVNQSANLVASSRASLDQVHTVPDPYYVQPFTRESPRLSFVNLPPQAVIRIYSLSGVVVEVIEHNPADFAGEAFWDVTNRAGRQVASGVYFYHVETPEGLERVGRFTIINASGVE